MIFTWKCVFLNLSPHHFCKEMKKVRKLTLVEICKDYYLSKGGWNIFKPWETASIFRSGLVSASLEKKHIQKY